MFLSLAIALKSSLIASTVYNELVSVNLVALRETECTAGFDLLMIVAL